MAKSRVRFLNDPIRQMARWAQRRYRLPAFDVLYTDKPGNRKSAGCTTFFSGRAPVVELNAAIPVNVLLKVLEHELAHIRLHRRGRHGLDLAWHGPEFRKAKREIRDAWDAYCESESQNGKGRLAQ